MKYRSLIITGWFVIALTTVFGSLWFLWFLQTVLAEMNARPKVVQEIHEIKPTKARFSGTIYYGYSTSGETVKSGMILVVLPNKDRRMDPVTGARVENGRFTTPLVLDPNVAYLLFFDPDEDERKRKSTVWDSWPNNIGWPTPQKPGESVNHTVVFPVTLTLSLSS